MSSDCIGIRITDSKHVLKEVFADKLQTNQAAEMYVTFRPGSNFSSSSSLTVKNLEMSCNYSKKP